MILLTIIDKIKILKLESTYNTRDLGGYKIFDGKATKYNVFLCSDNTHKLTEKDIETLKNYNVKTIVDLRKDKELLEKPSKLIDISGIKYYRVDIHGILYSHYGNNIKKIWDADFSYSYGYELQYTGEGNWQKKIIDLIANIKKGCVLFHCNSGKDRTGIVAMLLLGLVGVNKDDIISNYILRLIILFVAIQIIKKSVMILLIRKFKNQVNLKRKLFLSL